MDQKQKMAKRRRRVLRWLLVPVALLAALAGGYYLYARFVLVNFHTVVDNQVYRSAQPDGETLERWARQYKLRTVINLRGRSTKPFYAAEVAAARRAGLTHIDIRFSAWRQPSLPSVRGLIEALETAERPILLHCQAGADRAGMASVLAAMAVGGEDFQAAKGQLSFRYLRFDNHPEHISGFLRQYETYCRKNGQATAGWRQFKGWALEVYHPYYYFVRITAPQSLSAAPGETLHVPLTIRNDSHRTIPAGDDDKVFSVASFTGTSEADKPDREFGRTTLPKQDIPPGKSVTLEHALTAPVQPGRYIIRFDVIEERRTWFGRQGSPVPSCELRVAPPAGVRKGS